MRLRVLRVERDAPRVRLVFGLATIPPILLVVRVPEIEPPIAMVRVQRDAVLERRDGLGLLLLVSPRDVYLPARSFATSKLRRAKRCLSPPMGVSPPRR